MQIKIFEPATGDILTRADVRNMRLPFKHGWYTWLVTDGDRILGRHDTFSAAATHKRILEPLPLAA